MPKNLDIYLAIDITLVLIHELLAVIRALRRNHKAAASIPASGSIYLHFSCLLLIGLDVNVFICIQISFQARQIDIFISTNYKLIHLYMKCVSNF
jgi:hypothetical protein